MTSPLLTAFAGAWIETSPRERLRHVAITSPEATRRASAAAPFVSLEALEALRGRLGLYRRSPTATPFQSPEWLIPWWRHYGEGELLAWSFWREERLVGLAPLYCRVENGIRRVLLIGAGNSDYLDLLSVPGEEDTVAIATLEALAAESSRGDIGDLHELPPGAIFAVAPAPRGWRERLAPQSRCPVLDLSAPQPLPPIWHEAERLGRALARCAAVTEMLATEANFEAMFTALLDLHLARWRERGGAAGLGTARDLAFHRAAAQGFLRAGALRLHALLADGAIIAVLYALHARRRTFFYLSGFDPAFERFSPGTLVLASAIRHARGEGATAFDFLRGAEPYKYRWGAEDRHTQRRTLWRESS